MQGGFRTPPTTTLILFVSFFAYAAVDWLWNIFLILSESARGKNSHIALLPHVQELTSSNLGQIPMHTLSRSAL